MKTRDANYLQKHAIPASDAGWPLAGFPAFVKERERRIKERIEGLIGETL